MIAIKDSTLLLLVCTSIFLPHQMTAMAVHPTVPLTISCMPLQNGIPDACNGPIWLNLVVKNTSDSAIDIDVSGEPEYGTTSITAPLTERDQRLILGHLEGLDHYISLAKGGEIDLHILLNDFVQGLKTGTIKGQFAVPIEVSTVPHKLVLTTTYTVDISSALTPEQAEFVTAGLLKEIEAPLTDNQSEAMRSVGALPDDIAMPIIDKVLDYSHCTPWAFSLLTDRPRTPDVVERLQTLAASPDKGVSAMAKQALNGQPQDGP